MLIAGENMLNDPMSEDLFYFFPFTEARFSFEPCHMFRVIIQKGFVLCLML